jgi:hypothetical protein
MVFLFMPQFEALRMGFLFSVVHFIKFHHDS